jgi:hypothetical protein
MTPIFKSFLGLLLSVLGLFALFVWLATPANAQVADVDNPKLAVLRRFETLHEAAMFGAQRLEDCSHYYECSAAIATDRAGKFVVGPVRTDYAGDHVGVDASVPSKWKLVGDIHSHPCVPDHVSAMFSPQDLSGMIVHRLTGYMVDLCTGKVHEFIPDVTKPDETLVDDEVWLTEGNIIGQVAAFPSEPSAHEGI